MRAMSTQAGPGTFDGLLWQEHMTTGHLKTLGSLVWHLRIPTPCLADRQPFPVSFTAEEEHAGTT